MVSPPATARAGFDRGISRDPRRAAFEDVSHERGQRRLAEVNIEIIFGVPKGRKVRPSIA